MYDMQTFEFNDQSSVAIALRKVMGVDPDVKIRLDNEANDYGGCPTCGPFIETEYTVYAWPNGDNESAISRTWKDLGILLKEMLDA